jgi:tagatose-1,6-bisphosphate aldolase
LEVLADSDGIVAALAIDQRNALRSLFARSERRSGMCLERKRSSSFDKRARKKQEYAPKGIRPRQIHAA